MAAESIIRGLLNKGKSVRNIEEPWWSKRYGDILGGISEIPAAYNKAKMYTGNKLDDTYDSLVNLLKVSDSEAGMATYEKKLNEFTSDAQKFGGYDDNIVQAETLKMLGNQKKQMHGDFSLAIKAANEELFQSDDFLDEAKDFVNIQGTMDSRKIKGSVADFLQSELANANRLRDGMVAGFQIQGDEIVGTNFRYNKGVNDKETFRKLNLYRDRLDLAVKSLAGDKMISPEEAEAIIIGDEKHYSQAKGDALRKAEYNYKANKGMVVEYDGLINTALQKKLSADDIFNMKGLDDAGKLEMGGNLTAGSWDAVITQLTNKKGEYQELRNIANKDFDVGIGAGMRMVDDTEIPASAEEIEKARQIYLQNQMGPYYKYGIENLVEEEPEEKSLPNEGLLRILSNPTYKGVL